MSNGVFDWPLRTTHPTAPDAGRLFRYTFDDGAGTVEPYYMLEDGIPRTLKGDQGDQGIQGIQGPAGNDGADGADGVDGAQGPIGPAGPMNVEGFVSEPVTVTLPNTTTQTVIYSDTINFSATGNAFLDVSLASRPHSTGNDLEYFIRWDGVILTPVYAEEHKDVSTAQSMWRSQCFDLGNVTAGNHTLELLFSKEATGGTAQLKNYTAKAVRY